MPRCQCTVAGGMLRCTPFTSATLQAVSYKWLARERLLPANLAKQLLFAFAEAHRGKVAATYLLAGWVKDGAEGGEARHVVKLVPAACLAKRTAELDRVTDMHVHSVQPTQPKARAKAQRLSPQSWSGVQGTCRQHSAPAIQKPQPHTQRAFQPPWMHCCFGVVSTLDGAAVLHVHDLQWGPAQGCSGRLER